MTTSTVMPGLGHNGGPPLTGITGSPWLAGAPAYISRRKRPITTSGQARTGEWVLRFERSTPPFIEPLMGWTGGEDALSQVEITFNSRDEAIRYAEREGLLYRVEGGITGERTPLPVLARRSVQVKAHHAARWRSERIPAARATEIRPSWPKQADDPEKFAAVDEAATEFPAEPSPRAGRLGREAPVPASPGRADGATLLEKGGQP